MEAPPSSGLKTLLQVRSHIQCKDSMAQIRTPKNAWAASEQVGNKYHLQLQRPRNPLKLLGFSHCLHDDPPQLPSKVLQLVILLLEFLSDPQRNAMGFLLSVSQSEQS